MTIEKMLEVLGQDDIEEENNWTKYVPVVIFVLLIAIYIAIMLFAPDWVKFLATGWVVGRIIFVNRDKLMSPFKK